MATVELYEPAQFEPLTDEPWDRARVEDAIATIVAEADAAFDPEALWPAHDWDGWRAPLPMKNLYVGAAGVIWALDELRKRGHAESSRDLAAAVVRAVELERATPDFSADEHYRPGDGRMDGRAALGGGGARDGRSAARTSRRRWALAAG